MVRHPQKITLFFALMALLWTPSAMAEEKMVESLMKLRADVEMLYSRIDENKDAFKSQIKSYALQISDTEAQINRQETTLKLTTQELEKQKDKLDETASKTKDISPMIFSAIDKLKAEIQAGIPFKIEERIASLDQIKYDLENKTITQEKALALTWASYDDALRLTKEVGLFKQEIEVDGKSTLANIAKVGSVMLFFATTDDRVGYATKDGDGYRYKVESEEERKAQIVALFDALQKQIRTGYFSLPNGLLLQGGN